MKILLATDGSEYSEWAARFLTRFNFSSEDGITVLHVISEVPFKVDRESYYAGLKRIKQEVAPRILDSTIDKLKSIKARISTAFLDGYPGNTIIDAAVDSNMDLIVMGSMGLKGIKSFVIGGTTRSVLINSPKPILVVKPPQWKTSEKLSLLYATDGSDYAMKAGRVLASMPFPEDTEMTIISVITSFYMDMPDWLHVEVKEKVRVEVAEIRGRELKHSEEIIEKAKRDMSARFAKITGLTRTGDPAQVIIATANYLKSDIIAVGSRGIRGAKGMLGSVSRNIIGHSECSVLIGK